MVMGRKKGSKSIHAVQKFKIVELVRADMTQAHVSRFYKIIGETFQGMIRRSKNLGMKNTKFTMQRKRECSRFNNSHTVNLVTAPKRQCSI